MPLIVDAHQDIAYNRITFGRDFREVLSVTRAREVGQAVETENGIATAALDRALAGNIAIIFSTLFVSPTWGGFPPVYHNQQEAHEQALAQVAIYEDLFTHPQIRPILTQHDLRAVLAAQDLPLHERPIGLVRLMENADPIREPQEVGWWVAHGVRIIGPAWSGTRYSGGTVYHGQGGGGLTADGHVLLAEMAQHGVILDVSHMAEEAFYTAMDVFGGHVIASHSNPRYFSDRDRHLSDAMLDWLIARDAVIGLVPYNYFLHQERSFAMTRAHTPLSRYLDAIQYVCDLAGDARHAGIGSDYDGGFGREQIPVELDSIGDFPLIADGLSARGFSDEDIAAICGGNFIRVLEAALPLDTHG